LDGENEVESASAPKAIGIITNNKLERGCILCKNSVPIITKNILSLIFCLIENIEEGKKYVLRVFNQEVKCKVDKIFEKIDVESLKSEKDVKILKETKIGKVKFSLEKPIVIEKFENLNELGRFVILKNGKIIGGGII
jgi:sulfate adenylyltransferase subunit 1 (EFTu-like GTPase family)